MKISVVIPCHNSADFLEQCLDSVAAQKLQPYEVIVVDDSSKDNSAEVARGHQTSPIVLKVNHGNAAPTRNAGIERAAGDWVAFLDADNIWFPDHLSNAKQLLDASRDILFASPPVHESEDIPDQEGTVREDHPLAQPASGLKEIDFVRWRLNYLWGYPTSGTVARLDRVREVGGFDITQKRRHDFELVMRVIAEHTWCGSPVATWWSRPIRQGNISSDKPACAFYAYRALHLNREAFDSEDFRHLIRKAALNATKNAVYARDPELKRDAMALASPDMGLKEKIKLGIFSLTPPQLRSRLINY
jgi:glycosyltransferase involved in cell wall biosynthesis